MSDPNRKPDAILHPTGWRPPKGDAHGHFEAVLGVKPVWICGVPGFGPQARLASPICNDTVLFPKEHELAGQPRYEWQDRPDGLKYGYLVPEAAAAEAQA
jgi:hypothetical protein